MLDNNNLLKTWRKEGFTLHLYDCGYSFERGKSKLGYIFKDGRKVIFQGEDYYPSPLHAIDSLEVVYALLGFLSVQKGDTDSEYFENYTPEQIAWSESARCEYLSLLVNDFESKQ